MPIYLNFFHALLTGLLKINCQHIGVNCIMQRRFLKEIGTDDECFVSHGQATTKSFTNIEKRAFGRQNLFCNFYFV